MPDRQEIAARLQLLDRLIVTAIVLAYGLSLIALAFIGGLRLWWLLLVPALTFILVSILRAAIDAPRPYERGVQPLLAPSRAGRSFPSRHVASGAVIGTSLMGLNLWLGLAILGMSALLGWIRVRGGLHFPRDVIAGLIIGGLCGLVSWVGLGVPTL